MARALDATQQAELSAFVNRLAQIAGYETTAEWARDSGYPASNLSNLRNGRGSVDGYNLLRLVRAAAARAHLDELDLALVTTGRPPARSAEPTNAELGRRLEEVAALVTEGLARLGAGIDGAAQQRDREEHPTPASESPR